MACQNKEKGYDIHILATDSHAAALKPHTSMKVLAWESCVRNWFVSHNFFKYAAVHQSFILVLDLLVGFFHGCNSVIIIYM